METVNYLGMTFITKFKWKEHVKKYTELGLKCNYNCNLHTALIP